MSSHDQRRIAMRVYEHAELKRLSLEVAHHKAQAVACRAQVAEEKAAIAEETARAAANRAWNAYDALSEEDTPRHVRDPEPRLQHHQEMLAMHEDSARLADARAEWSRDRLGEMRRGIAADDAFARAFASFTKRAG